MMIERLGPVDPLSPAGNSGKATRAEKADRSDAINLSVEAKEKGEIFRAVEISKQTPDVRLDKIAEIKKKLQDPSYIDDAVVKVVAERVMDVFGLK
jgi:negative regulator of flagellin synthesis FlgM